MSIKLRVSIYFALTAACIILLELVTRSPEKYNWEMGKTNFSVYYTSTGTMLPGEIIIKISDTGEYEFIEYSGRDGNRKVDRRYTGKLTNSDMEELFDYMINEVDFFNLEEKITVYNTVVFKIEFTVFLLYVKKIIFL